METVTASPKYQVVIPSRGQYEANPWTQDADLADIQGVRYIARPS